MKPDVEISILRKEVDDLRKEIKYLKYELDILKRKDVDLGWRS